MSDPKNIVQCKSGVLGWHTDSFSMCTCLFRHTGLAEGLKPTDQGTVQTREHSMWSRSSYLSQSWMRLGKRPQGTLYEKGRSNQATSKYCPSGEGATAVYSLGGPSCFTSPVETFNQTDSVCKCQTPDCFATHGCLVSCWVARECLAKQVQ